MTDTFHLLCSTALIALLAAGAGQAATLEPDAGLDGGEIVLGTTDGAEAGLLSPQKPSGTIDLFGNEAASKAPVANETAIRAAKVVEAIQRLARSQDTKDAEILEALLTEDRVDARGWAFLGIWAADQGHRDTAMRARETAVLLDPENPQVRLSDAVVTAFDGNKIKAVEILRALTNDVPQNLTATDRLARLYFDMGRPVRATAAMERTLSVVGHMPSTAPFRFQLASIYVNMDNPAAALPHLRKLLLVLNASNALSEATTIMAAQAAFEVGNLTEAEEFLQMRSEWPSELERVALVRAGVELSLKGSGQAARQLEKLAAHPVLGVTALRYLGDAAFRDGLALRGAKFFEQAAEQSDALQKVGVLERLSEHLFAAGLVAESNAVFETRLEELGNVGHVILTDRLLSQNNHMGAMAAAKAGRMAFPGDSELAYLAGMAKFMMGDSDGAKVDFEKATELNPDHSRAWVSLAKLLHDRGGHGGVGRHVDVIAVYERALQQSPDNAIVKIELGKVAQEEGRPKDAEDWYRKALASAPGDPLAQSLLAILLVEQGRVDEARALANAAGEALPGHHQVLFAKGRVAYARERFAEAGALMMNANAARPEHGHSLAYAASAFVQAGNTDEGARVADAALYLGLRPEEVEMARQVLMTVKGKADVVAPIQRIDLDGVHEAVGEIAMTDTMHGLKITISMGGLRQGMNALHLHENPTCAPGYREDALVAGLTAGAHLGAAQSGGGHAHHHGPAIPAAGVETPKEGSGPEDQAGSMMMDHAGMGEKAASKDAPMKRMAMAQGETMSDAQAMAGMAMPQETKAKPEAKGHGGHAAPMVMEMTHGDMVMNMLMRAGDLPIGDLPMLIGDEAGKASAEYTVPYLHSSMLNNRSIVVHDGMESRRAYCGVITF